MKKLTILLLLFFFSVGASFSANPIRYGVEGGVSFSRNKSFDFKFITSFRVGGNIEYAIPMSAVSEFLFSSGLLFTEKGGRINDLRKITMSAYYLQVPLNIGFRQRLTSDFKLVEEFGPYLAYGLFGKTKISEFIDDAGKVFPQDNFNTFSRYKRFDAGLGLKLGIEYNEMIRLSWGMDIGFLKTAKDIKDYPDTTGENFSTYISLGFFF